MSDFSEGNTVYLVTWNPFKDDEELFIGSYEKVEDTYEAIKRVQDYFRNRYSKIDIKDDAFFVGEYRVNSMERLEEFIRILIIDRGLPLT